MAETTDYESLTVAELRPLVIREIGSGAWIQSASKAGLLMALRTGKAPEQLPPAVSVPAALAASLAAAVRACSPAVMTEGDVRRIVREELAAALAELAAVA